MGFLASTVSFSQFRTTAIDPALAAECLQKKAFRNIEDTNDEESIGWVQGFDHKSADFSNPEAILTGDYLFFALRRDRRKIPAALLRDRIAVASALWLEENFTFKRIPKGKKEEIVNAVRGELLAKTLPAPEVIEVVWNTRSGLVFFGSYSDSAIELFENLFRATFEGLRLRAYTPVEQCQAVAPPSVSEKMDARCGREMSVLNQMKEGEWIGRGFLSWLFRRTIYGWAGGPDAYINDRLRLVGGGDEGVQTVTVSGPQDRFDEVKHALEAGKEITEATIYIENHEETFRFTLRGPTFRMASMKCPRVTIEKGKAVDAESERRAIFLERMGQLVVVLSLFNRLLSCWLVDELN